MMIVCSLVYPVSMECLCSHGIKRTNLGGTHFVHRERVCNLRPTFTAFTIAFKITHDYHPRQYFIRRNGRLNTKRLPASQPISR